MKKHSITLKTARQLEIETRDMLIYEEYYSLMAIGSASTEVTFFLADKYGLKDPRYIYRSLKRVKKRLKFLLGLQELVGENGKPKYTGQWERC